MDYSFIIPVYNCWDTLTDCVRSILAAGLADMEILLIDDGSVDGSGALCDALAEAYPQVRVFHQTNRGVSAARNRGLEAAKGDRVLFADGDDTLDGTALREVLKHSGDLLIFGTTVEHFHRGRCYGRQVLRYPKAGEVDWRKEFLELFEENALSPVWNKVYRRDILEENNLRFREDMQVYEDLEFVLRYLNCCEHVVNVPAAAYRYHPSSRASARARGIGSISKFLLPLENALARLGLGRKTVDAVRLRLYEILARQAWTRKTGRAICADFARWYGALESRPEVLPRFLRQLYRGRFWEISLHHSAAMLRHRIGMEVKTWISIL